MEQNIIVRGIGGFYDVLTPENRVIRCKLRGRLRLSIEKVLVGDWVEISVLNNGEGVIEKILPRKNELIRPPIANLDQAVVVLACSDPKPDWLFLDRLLVIIEANQLRPVICINKSDLLDQEQHLDRIELYQKIGYEVIVTSTVDNQGIDCLRAVLKDQVSTFAGPSGVGKSSLLNKIESGLELPVGAISTKLKRGRHTTRSVELIQLSFGGLVADTPGFSQLNLGSIRAPELQQYFPEIFTAASECKFRGCIHLKEPDCAVREMVASGEISELRYQNYLALLAEIEQKR
ncbi:MAG: ribosome small subunit-dependent GTPase A [Firmicutes bacterium]|nr:ribosome small subunit-dependent GTPase A [Bacillota bacterium]